MKIFLAIALSFLALNSSAALSTKGLSTVQTASGKPWFQLEKTFTETVDGTRGQVVFRDEESKVLSEETIVISNDGVLQTYEWQQLQDKQSFSLRLNEKKWEIDFKGSKDSIDLPRDPTSVVVPPMIAERLAQEWTKNPALKDFAFKLLVPDRRELFSFKFVRMKDKDGRAHWLLSPENFFVRLVAGEILFVYDADKVLKEIRDFRPPVKFRTPSGRLEERKTSITF